MKRKKKTEILKEYRYTIPCRRCKKSRCKDLGGEGNKSCVKFKDWFTKSFYSAADILRKAARE